MRQAAGVGVCEAGLGVHERQGHEAARYSRMPQDILHFSFAHMRLCVCVCVQALRFLWRYSRPQPRHPHGGVFFTPVLRIQGCSTACRSLQHLSACRTAVPPLLSYRPYFLRSVLVIEAIHQWLLTRALIFLKSPNPPDPLDHTQRFLLRLIILYHVNRELLGPSWKMPPLTFLFQVVLRTKQIKAVL